MTKIKHSVFDYGDYRDLILHFLEQKKLIDTKLTHQDFARECQLQKGYLSRVFKKERDLSRDQLYLATEFLKLSKIHREFLFLLHDYNRSGLHARRHKIEVEIFEYKKKYSATEHHIKTDKVLESEENPEFKEFFLNPEFQLLHIFLLVPRFRQNLGLLAKCFEARVLNRGLEILQILEIIKIVDNRIDLNANKFLHLPATHSIYQTFRILTRLKALAKIQNNHDQGNYGFSAFFAGDLKIRDRTREKFLKFLAEVQQDSVESEKEDVYQITFDILKWS